MPRKRFLCPSSGGHGGFMLLTLEEIKRQLRLEEDYSKKIHSLKLSEKRCRPERKRI
jgi:hypothetical protein